MFDEADTMLTIKTLAVTFACSLLLCAGVARAASETVQLSIGAVKSITLSENTTTGYRWQINKGQSTNLAIVQIGDDGHQQSSGGRIGAAGTHRWRIKALAAGTARVVFDYVRPWEHAAPAQRHTVVLEISPRL
jgi:inhibitor of cysteine peptidase